MNEETTYYNGLIIKHFSGEATEKEMAALSIWLESSPEHQQLFTEYRKSWEFLELVSIERTVDVDKEWAQFEKRINQNSPLQVEYRAPRKKLYYRMAAIAAILIVLFVSTLLVYRYSATIETMNLVATTENNQGILPDGSQVTLAPGSYLSYPEKFKNETRLVTFRGEGFFEITKDPEQPFIIEAGNNVCIEVLGTSFYVNTNRADSLVEVILVTGQVAVYLKDRPDEKTLMEPGEKVTMASQQHQANKTVNTDKNYMAWKSGKLIFEDTPLDEVIRLMNKVYHTEAILMQADLAKCTITATFENQSADAVFHVIEETLALNIYRKGNQIQISGKGCTE